MACVELWTFSDARGRLRRFGESPRFNALAADVAVKSYRNVRENFLVVRDKTTAERADTGDPESSFARCLPLGWHPPSGRGRPPITAAGIRKRDLGCAHPATRACRSRHFRFRRRSGRGARKGSWQHHANHVPRPGCGGRLWAYVREERRPVRFERDGAGTRSRVAT